MGLTARARLSRRLRARAADERGFTLPELLITMAILLIVVGSLASVLVSASKSEIDASKRFQVQEQDRTALDKLRRELHCANTVAVKNSAGTTLSAGTAGSAVAVTLGSTCPTNITHAATLYVTWCTSASTLTTGDSASVLHMAGAGDLVIQAANPSFDSTLTTGDYALYRVTSTSSAPTCASTGKVKWTDYLQPTTVSPSTSTPFCLPSTIAACSGVLRPSTSLPMLHVILPVDINGPTSTIDKYNLVDDIAIRNVARS